MSKPKIVLISSEFPPGPGGIGKHAFDVARALSAKGNEVTVFASQDFSDEIEKVQFNGQLIDSFNIVSFQRTGASTYYNRWSVLKKWVNHNKPEKAIVTGRYSLWLGYLLKLRYGSTIKVHAFVHGSELSRKNKCFHWLTTRSLQSIDHIWAVSSFTGKLIKAHVNRDDIKFLPNGLWFSDWNSSDNKSENFNLTGNPILLTVGQLSLRKGQHRVLKVLPVIKKRFPDVHYHMAGIPSNKERLIKLAQQYNVNADITIHGRIASSKLLEKFYKASHLFIMLSENQKDGDAEGFGIAILEANYFGKPAIGAKGCGIEDAIADGYNGRLVDGNNAEEIVDAIEDIMIHYDEYAARAKKWASKHDWSELIKRFEDSKGMNEHETNYFKS